jgi:hypothetical protein
MAGVSVAGCLDRPVVPGEPTTKTNFTTKVAEQAVDKIDILFDIDNSASMGDKQAYLEAAVPDLINRLVTPNCVLISDPTVVKGVSVPDSTGAASCATIDPPNTQLEFPAVHDMHIGIVSSSLGPRLGDQVNGPNYGACAAATMVTIGGTAISEHNDDQAHLLTRQAAPTPMGAGMPPSYAESPLPDAQNGFLAWYPNVQANSATPPANAITSSTTLASDFTDLVAGVHEFGCGIESQLESWYRFLIQPDPYASLALDGSQHAQWVGVDTEILQERHDFLRPDSLVAIIVLTDENDSEIDVRSLGGQGYLFMSTAFQPYRGTSKCDTDPSDPACESCAYFLQNGGTGDPNCAGDNDGGTDRYTSPYDWGYDLNLRHVHMQAKYGLSPQFPLSRYVNGLTNGKVPDRVGEYPTGAVNYQGNNNCTNPLFAASLPDPSVAGTFSSSIATSPTSADVNTLCNLQSSTQRPTSLVFYAHIGGVPNQLLHFDPTSATNSELSDADWVRILGTDPDNYNYNGIDPHMIESYQPRVAGSPQVQGITLASPLPAPTYPSTIDPPTGPTAKSAETAIQPPTASATADPYSGREWITNNSNPAHIDLNVDREYACIFPITPPRDCTNDGGVWTVPANQYACDCSSTGLTAEETSPLCNPSAVNSQVFAKAYPTIRELSLAHKMGNQGIVSSLCPIDPVDMSSDGTDPYYGYRPAVATIVNRLKNALTNQCLPETLTQDSTGAVPCLILATLPATSQQNKNNPENDCNNASAGLAIPDPTTLAQFLQTAEAAWIANGGADGGAGQDPKTLPTCVVSQITNVPAGSTCKTSNTAGWCYVSGAAAGTCPQAIVFTSGTPPSGSTINLQCIETNAAQSAGTQTTGDGG